MKRPILLCKCLSTILTGVGTKLPAAILWTDEQSGSDFLDGQEKTVTGALTTDAVFSSTLNYS